MLLRAARIVHIETPDDPTYEALLEKTLGNDPQNESANFLYEDLLSRTERWDALEEHHMLSHHAVTHGRPTASQIRDGSL